MATEYGKIVEEFKNQLKELELKKDRVKNNVDTAIRQAEVIEKDIQGWLEEAEKELEYARRLEDEIERKKCISWCPNWGWRYSLSKKVAKKMLCITKLLQSSDFPLQEIKLFPSKDFMPSKSSTFTFNGIIKALNTNDVNMIGLYGMRGVGKTTLAKQVGKYAKERKLFDNVVMVTMSQTPNISNIQGRIAELLGLEFEATTEDGKAEELCRILKGVKKILIIIDDVWDRFELQTIGIPFGVEHVGCKILLTTRLQRVCDDMGCEEKFHLDVLSEDEAWALFKDNACLKDVSSTLKDVAQNIASKCNGLPLAIVTIGKVLKDVDQNRWEAVAELLHYPELEDEIDYKFLKISYDDLESKDIQSCFLLCSLFPRDFNIGIEWLIMFGIGYGLFSDDYSMNEYLWMKFYEAVRTLQNFGLLRKADDNEEEICVSMHDAVRDFAHRITLGEEEGFMVKERLTEWPSSENFEGYTAISSWNSNVNSFPDELKFSKLRIFVFTGSNLVRIPIAFVKGMKVLQVLYLKNVIFSLKVFEFIKNLRTLCFENCKLKKLSSLRNLKNLEFLALLDNDIFELPEELVALSKLKSLHISCYGDEQSKFRPNLLSRLTSLQELHVTCPNNVNLSELNSLPHLTALSLRVSTDQCIQENFVFSAKLQRYMIAVNEDMLGYMKGLKSRTFKIKDFSSSLSAFKELFCNVEKLTLECCNDVECLKELCHGPLRIEFLQNLIDVSIADCKQLKVVFQIDEILEAEEITSPFPILPKLKSLHLQSLSELENIWRLPSTPEYHASLQSLKVVKVEKCNKLKSIFSNSVSRSMVHLEELVIFYCNKLEKVFDFSQEMAEFQNIELPRLRRLALKGLESLSTCCSREFSIGLPSLEELEVEECPQLWSICEITNHTEVKVTSHAEAKNILFKNIELPRLRRLALKRLKSLTTFFPEEFPIEFSIKLSSFEELEVEGCPQLSICQIIRDVEVKDLRLSKMGRRLFEEIIQLRGGCYLSSLKKLMLKEISELELIFKDPSQIVTLENLSHLTVFKCNKLRNIFSVPLARNLPQLSHLEVEECEELEQVVVQDEISSSSSMAPQEYVCFLKLENVCIKKCNKLKSLFPVSFCRLPKLKSLQVVSASNLREIFRHDVNMTKDEKLRKDLLPKLEELFLEDLQKFIWFTRVVYSFAFPALKSLSVKECPSIAMKFSIIRDDSGGSFVRAEIEKSKLPKEGEAESSIGMQITDLEPDDRQNIEWHDNMILETVNYDRLVAGSTSEACPMKLSSER